MKTPRIFLWAIVMVLVSTSGRLWSYTLGNLQTAQDGTIETIPLEATVQESPAQIRIKTYAPGTFTIYRKSPSDQDWGTPLASGVSLTQEGVWTDSSVTVGTLYEYRFVNSAGSPTNGIFPSGYILCGIKVDNTASRGRMAVLVASDVPTTLAPEFAQYKADLVADGWTIHEVSVPRAANYAGLGNGTIQTVKVNSGGTGYATGDYVRLDGPAGKVARGKVTAASGAVTAISIPVNGGGRGFAVNDALTVSGGTTTGSGASFIGHVNTAEMTLKSATSVDGGSGYTNGEVVTLTGAVSGKTAQATILVSGASNAIFWLYINSSQTGFILEESLIMSGNKTGTGVGNILAAGINGLGMLTAAGTYSAGSGYVEGDQVTITGVTSGKTAQALLHASPAGVIYSLEIVSSQIGFINGESLTISGNTAGSGIGPFTAEIGGPMVSVEVRAGGTNYVNGNVVTFSSLSGSTTLAEGVLNVTNGAVTSVTLNSPGAGYVDGDALFPIGLQSIGGGATATVTAVDNSNVGRKVNVTAGGSGYRDNDPVTISGAGGSVTGSIIAPSGTITGISAVLPATFAAGETLTITPASGGTGATASADSTLRDYHLLIREAVQALNTAYPGELKNLAVIGKVPVCRSGRSGGPDGHGNRAPYGNDAFFADMDGVVGVDWTDNMANTADSLIFNTPGDGQFDQQAMEEVGNGGRVELGFGRIDLSLFIQTETEAMRTYFWKLHRYKTAAADFRPGRRVLDRWTYANERETQLQSMPGTVGMSNVEFITNAQLPRVITGQDADALYSAQNGPYLFYFKGNSGPMQGVGGRAVFWTGMQSHWGYWYESNLPTNGPNSMQKALAEDNFTLSYTWNIWGVRYIYHRMGMGLDAGDMMRQSLNNRGWTTDVDGGPYTYKFNAQNNGDYHTSLFMAHMGDPALRLFMFEPPSALSVVKSGSSPVLTWTASPDPGVIGYHIYRAPYPSAPFARLTTTPVNATTYSDSSVTSGNPVYMVRAVRLETTGGGTFYNASLGITQSVSLDSAPSAVGITTTTIAPLSWNSPASITLAASGGVPQYGWALESGTLPNGLSLSSEGVISGTPINPGTYAFAVRVTDQINQTATRSYTVTVTSNSATVLYPEATTYTDKARPTVSFGADEANYISGIAANQYETFQRYDLSGLTVNNSFVRATLYLYVTSGTAAGTIANVQASLIADAQDGWIERGIARPFTGAANNGSGKTRITCPGHEFTNGIQVSLAGLTGSGAPSSGPYTITVVDADRFDLLTVPFGTWQYDPALAFVSTTSMTYNTRPTTYSTTAPTISGSGVNTPGTLLQFDVTPFVRETLAGDPLKKLGLRFFTGTPQTVAISSSKSFGASRPYIVFETTNGPDITVNRPTDNPAYISTGTGLLLDTTVKTLPERSASLSLLWTKLSGPNAVTFSRPGEASTAASFAGPGEYVIRLTATDGVAQSFRDIPVRVIDRPVAGPADSSLLLYLPFDEGTGTTASDIMTPGRQATLTGGALWASSGRIGNAAALGGTGQYAVIPDSVNKPLDGLSQMTLSVWINQKVSETDSSINRAIIAKSANQYDGSYVLRLRGGTGGKNTLYVDMLKTSFTGATQIEANKWNHLVLVFDGTQSSNNVRYYLNGNPDKFVTVSGATQLDRKTTRNFFIGAFGTTDTKTFNGIIDEVRVYNRALSGDEIRDLAQAVPARIGPAVSVSGPISGTTGSSLPVTGTASSTAGPVTLQWSAPQASAAAAFADPAAASTTVSFNQPGTYTVRLTADDGSISTWAETSASITPAPGMSSWLQQHFGTTDATGSRAPTANPASDGLPNLLKYALDLDPNQAYSPAEAGLNLGQTNVSDQDYLTYTFTGTAADVTYIVEATNGLGEPWTTIYSHSGSAPGTVTVNDTQPIQAATKRFLRLRVTTP